MRTILKYPDGTSKVVDVSFRCKQLKTREVRADAAGNWRCSGVELSPHVWEVVWKQYPDSPYAVDRIQWMRHCERAYPTHVKPMSRKFKYESEAFSFSASKPESTIIRHDTGLHTVTETI